MKYRCDKARMSSFLSRFVAQSHLESHDVSRLSIKTPFARCFSRFASFSSSSPFFGTHKEQFRRWSGTLSPLKIMSQENPSRRWKAARGKKGQASATSSSRNLRRRDPRPINHQQTRRRFTIDSSLRLLENRDALSVAKFKCTTRLSCFSSFHAGICFVRTI